MIDELNKKCHSSSEKLVNLTKENNEDLFLSQIKKFDEMTLYYTGLNSNELFNSILKQFKIHK